MVIVAGSLTRPWVVPPVNVAMRLGMLLLDTGENQRSDNANCDAM